MKLRNASDWVIALVVVLCSLVLFAALAAALSGTFLGRPSRVIRADFTDITGVGVNSEVRMAGAPAGLVTGVEILPATERAKSPNPAAAVRLTLALRSNVPAPTQSAVASISSDTILSDKFVLLEDPDPSAPLLAEDGLIAGTAPVTVDAFLRRTDRLITALDGLMGGSGESAHLLTELRTLLDDTRGVVASVRSLVEDADDLVADFGTLPGEVRPVLADFRSVAGDAGDLIREVHDPMRRAVADIEKAAAALERLSTDGSRLIASTEPNLAALISELRTTAQNAKVAATYARIFTRSITRNPAQLLWGTRRPPQLPSTEEILSTKGPIATP
jgi:ABC-type transporter Mla subunit MlaD